MKKTIAVIHGDGIGPEIVNEALKVLDAVALKYHHTFDYQYIDMGGISIDKHGVPLTDEAIEIAKNAQNEQQPIYILGMIVHNQYIVDALKERGIQTIDIPGQTRLELLDQIQHGTVIVTAHGASEQVFEKAKNKGLNVIDASCLDVIKTHDLIKEKLNEGYDILYIGK